MITSRDNQTLKYAASLLARKHREREGKFLAEGAHLVGEALVSPGLVETLLYSEDFSLENLPGLSGFTGTCLKISSRLKKMLSDTETPQGIWAVCKKTAPPALEEMERMNLILFLAGIQDPGNAGTMVRSACALGADAVVFSTNAVDPFSPKAMRSSAGGIFRIPLFQGLDEGGLAELRNRGFRIAICDPGGNLEPRQADLTGKLALVIGNEAQGIPDAYHKMADLILGIPLYRNSESLNAAIACGIVLYEAACQRG